MPQGDGFREAVVAAATGGGDLSVRRAACATGATAALLLVRGGGETAAAMAAGVGPLGPLAELRDRGEAGAVATPLSARDGEPGARSGERAAGGGAAVELRKGDPGTSTLRDLEGARKLLGEGPLKRLVAESGVSTLPALSREGTGVAAVVPCLFLLLSNAAQQLLQSPS
mmetsp:Transcript_88563/g.206067  ORF Transcript_88563/g.206067 Transcript_88563/m.206067 type:complete len:170 (-) Transcript_88563:82-591(-)